MNKESLMKPKEQKVKRTYTKDEMNLLLLKEAFERDLPLFVSLVQKSESLFGAPMIGKDWSFTVVKDPAGARELHINVPTKKR